MHDSEAYTAPVLIQRFTSAKEKAFFKSEFAIAQEEIERQKKESRNVKKVRCRHISRRH